MVPKHFVVETLRKCALETLKTLCQKYTKTDRAERRAEEEECERSALDGQVEELRAALRRSRDAIEAIRLCDVEAETSASAAAAAAAVTAAAAAAASTAAAAGVPRDLPVTTPEVMGTDPGHRPRPLSSNSGARWSALPGRWRHHHPHHHGSQGGDGGRWDGSWNHAAGVAGVTPSVDDGYDATPVFVRRVWGGGGDGGGRGAFPDYHAREQLDGGEWVTQAVSSGDGDEERRSVRRRGRGSRRHGGGRSRGGQAVAEAEWWSDGDVDVDYASGGGGGGRGQQSRNGSRPRPRNSARGCSGGGGGADFLSVRSTPGRRWASVGDGRNSSGWYDHPGGNRTWGSEERGPSSGEEAYRDGDDGRGGRHSRSRSGGRRRRSSDRSAVVPAAAAAAAAELFAGERVEGADLLLAEERPRTAADLAAEIARFREVRLNPVTVGRYECHDFYGVLRVGACGFTLPPTILARIGASTQRVSPRA